MSNEVNSNKIKASCPQLPGTVLRIYIPAGTVINPIQQAGGAIEVL